MPLLLNKPSPLPETLAGSRSPAPQGQVGCKLVEQLFSTLSPPRPKSLICLENKIQSKSRSGADINETSVISGKFSTRHFHSNTETKPFGFGTKGKGEHSHCSTLAAPWLFPQFSSVQDNLLSLDTGKALSTASQTYSLSQF